MTVRQIGKTDIQFPDEKLRRLMAHVNRLTEEVQQIQAMLDEGQPGQVMTKLTGRDYDAGWGTGGGSSAGEANIAANVGDGVGVFRDKSGVQLNFRSLIGGAGIDIVIEADQIRITATDSAEQLEPIVIAGVFA